LGEKKKKVENQEKIPLCRPKKRTILKKSRTNEKKEQKKDGELVMLSPWKTGEKRPCPVSKKKNRTAGRDPL